MAEAVDDYDDGQPSNYLQFAQLVEGQIPVNDWYYTARDEQHPYLNGASVLGTLAVEAYDIYVDAGTEMAALIEANQLGIAYDDATNERVKDTWELASARLSIFNDVYEDIEHSILSSGVVVASQDAVKTAAEKACDEQLLAVNEEWFLSPQRAALLSYIDLLRTSYLAEVGIHFNESLNV